MSKRYAILQRKLQELESDLLQVLALPSETPCHQLLSDGIQQRFAFFNNLLSTELSASHSHPSKPPNYQLRHIAHRLSQFETAFRDWDNHRTSALAAVSTCSCTESCVNDDGDLGSPDLGSSAIYEDGDDDYPEMFADPVVEEKAPMESVGVESFETTERDVKREEGRVWGWRYCGVMGGGVVVGAVLMSLVMLRFCGCFHCYIEHGGSLIPT